ncbi:MAG: DUF3987 domain-containing protein [Chlamydiia bacterium]|nr:DUF3987 domain-containing protein [Chlamydiia bacterium]
MNKLFLAGFIRVRGCKMLNSQINYDGWDLPDNLDEHILPEWPTDILPKSLSDFVKEVARSTETPIEMATLLALSTIATVSMKNFIVHIHDSYQEPLALWTMTILPSGSRKSNVFNLITKPFIDLENEKISEHVKQFGNHDSKIKTLETKINLIRQKAAKASTQETYEIHQQKIEQLELDIKEMSRPLQMWTSDITPERLGTLMAQNNGAMSILSDEGNIFDIMAGLYSRGKSNIDIFLKGFSGGSVRIDRGNKSQANITEALISIGITVQPSVINNLCKNEILKGKGLLSRFLYSYPISNIGFRTNKEGPVDKLLQETFNNSIKKLLEFKVLKEKNKHMLTIETDAYEKWIENSQSIERRIHPEIGHLTAIPDWASKLSGQIIRIAAILHVYEHAYDKPWEHKISLQNMNRAIKMGHILTAHALKALHPESNNDHLIAREILDWVKKEKLKKFTQRECLRRFRRYKKDTLRKGIIVLLEHNFIAEHRITGNKGCPTIIFELNPFFTNPVK